MFGLKLFFIAVNIVPTTVLGCLLCHYAEKQQRRNFILGRELGQEIRIPSGHACECLGKREEALCVPRASASEVAWSQPSAFDDAVHESAFETLWCALRVRFRLCEGGRRFWGRFHVVSGKRQFKFRNVAASAIPHLGHVVLLCFQVSWVCVCAWVCAACVHVCAGVRPPVRVRLCVAVCVCVSHACTCGLLCAIRMRSTWAIWRYSL